MVNEVVASLMEAKGAIAYNMTNNYMYEDALPAIHIGFTDFTMCPEAPEFYATHMLLNIKNNRIYSDKFVLSVVDLTKIDLATEEDKEYKIDYWARIFKAKTWEELKTYMKKDECIDETIYSLYQANADEIIRERCLAREDAERRERTYKKFYQQYKEDYERAMVENAALQADKDALQADKDALQVNNVVLQKNIDDMKALIKELQEKLANKE